MAILVVDDGEVKLANLALNSAVSGENFTLHLFQNTTTFYDNTVAGDLTEANFTNYTSKTLTRGNWTITSVGGAAVATYNAAQSWTCGTSGNTVGGYYILDGQGNLIGGDNFTSPISLVDTDVLNVTPKLTFASTFNNPPG